MSTGSRSSANPRPEKSEPSGRANAKLPASQPYSQGPTREIARLQARAGNRAVQRLIQRRGGLIQRDDTIMYMDSSGVAHSKPDGAKTTPVVYIDSEGVGHKSPDTSPGIGTLFLDMLGVAHLKPDEVDPGIAQVLKIIQKGHDKGTGEAEKVTKGMAPWAARLVLAKQRRDAAEQAYQNGRATWDVEASGSPSTAATEAETAGTAAEDTKKHYEKTEQESQSVKSAASNISNWGATFAQNLQQFKRDKPVWLKNASPMTKEAIEKIDELFSKQGRASIEAINLSNTVDAEVAKFKTASDEAADFAERAWTPLKRGSSFPWVIVGMLQQKLNKVRPDATARLPVHALFTGATETALKAFQGANGLAQTGLANLATWTALDAAAPSTMQNDQLSVESKQGAQETKALGGKIHPEIKFGSSGNAVKEMQQRLNNWRAGQPQVPKPPFKPLKTDGKFGFADKSALKVFQRANGVTDSGIADQETWKKLDAVGGMITSGSREFDWRETVEGIDGVGMTSSYDWEITDDAIVITVKMKFTGASGHPMVAQWLQDIKDVWNNYKAVEQGVGVPREYKIEFKPVKSSSGKHKVAVKKPTKKNPNPRSDASNWYVNDTRRGLAPHEFGHLIGLEDEYNRPEEQAVAVSGLEPTIGQTESSTGKTAKEVSDELHAVITAAQTAGDEPKLIPKKIHQKLTEHGVKQGAFARLIEAWYGGDHGFAGEPDMSRYIAMLGDHKWTSDLTRATEVFMVSNQSLMGTMTSNMARGTDMTALAPHEHPVQPRHVRPFANLLSFAAPGTVWKPELR